MRFFLGAVACCVVVLSQVASCRARPEPAPIVETDVEPSRAQGPVPAPTPAPIPAQPQEPAQPPERAQPPETPHAPTPAVAPVAASREAAPAVADESVVPPPIRLPGGIEVDRAGGEVRIAASIAITAGFLEQVACKAGTRDHESLVVVDVKPRDVHAALLLLGLEPGQPGRWTYDEGRVATVPPRGAPIEVLVRWSKNEVAREARAEDWVRGVDGRAFPASWVFAGSRVRQNPPSFGPGEHYVADFTGSLVGLVTFGDEVIAATTVIADLVEIEAANWEAWTERMPPEGTQVTLVLRDARKDRGGER